MIQQDWNYNVPNILIVEFLVWWEKLILWCSCKEKSLQMSYITIGFKEQNKYIILRLNSISYGKDWSPEEEKKERKSEKHSLHHLLNWWFGLGCYKPDVKI